MGFPDEVPDFIREIGEPHRHRFTYMSDKGLIDRFYPEEIISDQLTIEKVKTILTHLEIKREKTDYLFYTATRPGNPLFEKPILDILAKVCIKYLK